MLTHSNKKGSDQPSSSEDTILVFGTTYYSEIILGKTFRVSELCYPDILQWIPSEPHRAV
jgi:hypothetical protein